MFSRRSSGALIENPEAMRQRRETDEHAFGAIKSWMGATHNLMRRLKDVRTEMALSVLAYNMTRIMYIIGRRDRPSGLGRPIHLRSVGTQLR